VTQLRRLFFLLENAAKFAVHPDRLPGAFACTNSKPEEIFANRFAAKRQLSRESVRNDVELTNEILVWL